MKAPSGTTLECGAFSACSEQDKRSALVSFTVQRGKLEQHPAASWGWVQDWFLDLPMKEKFWNQGGLLLSGTQIYTA